MVEACGNKRPSNLEWASGSPLVSIHGAPCGLPHSTAHNGTRSDVRRIAREFLLCPGRVENAFMTEWLETSEGIGHAGNKVRPLFRTEVALAAHTSPGFPATASRACIYPWCVSLALARRKLPRLPCNSPVACCSALQRAEHLGMSITTLHTIGHLVRMPLCLAFQFFGRPQVW